MSVTRKLETSELMTLKCNGNLTLTASGGTVISSGALNAASLTLTTPLQLGQGGLGAVCADGAAACAAIGAQVQNAYLDDIAALATQTIAETDYVLTWNGSKFDSLPPSVADNAITTAKLYEKSVIAAKLGSDVAGDGLSGGDGLPIDVDATVIRTTGAQTLEGLTTFKNGALFDGEVTQYLETGGMGTRTMRFYEVKTDDVTLSAPIVAIPSSGNTIAYFDVKITCCSANVNDYAAFNLFCVHVNKYADSTFTYSLVSPNTEIVARTTDISTATATMSDVSGTFTVTVTGVAGKNLRWNAHVSYILTSAHSSS